MKQEFKKGDRVLVRDSDLEEWMPAVFEEVTGRLFVASIDIAPRGTYFQCRHINDFRAYDRVQVRDSVTDEWEDATYAVHVPARSFEHWVFVEQMDDLVVHQLCRWHPSIPWAKKEQPLTLEQRVEALERKLTDK